MKRFARLIVALLLPLCVGCGSSKRLREANEDATWECIKLLQIIANAASAPTDMVARSNVREYLTEHQQRIATDDQAGKLAGKVRSIVDDPRRPISDLLPLNCS